MKAGDKVIINPCIKKDTWNKKRTCTFQDTMMKKGVFILQEPREDDGTFYIDGYYYDEDWLLPVPLFKPGDKVKIKSDLNWGDEYPYGVTDYMTKLAGRVCIIKDAGEKEGADPSRALGYDGFMYTLEEDEGHYGWSSPMFDLTILNSKHSKAMKRFAFKIDNNAKQLADILNWYTQGLGLEKMMGNGTNGYYYVLDFDEDTHQIMKLKCLLEPEQVTRFFYKIPPFMALPKDIQKEVILRSRDKSPIPFINNVAVSYYGGGFIWEEEPEGRQFWSDVLEHNNTEVFYSKFKKHLDNESRLQEQESPLRRGSREFTSGVRCRVNRARVEICSPGYQEVSGRG